MNLNIKGVISSIGERKQIKDTFAVIDFIVNVTENDYTNSYPIQANNDRIDYVEKLSVGDSVELSCNVNSKPYKSPSGEEKYFVSLTAYIIKKASGEPTAPKKVVEESLDPNDIFSEGFKESTDDLPF